MAPIQVTGVDELKREIRRLQDTEIKRELIAVNRELADEVIRIAEPNVPVRTGRLKASLRGSGNVSGAVGRVGGAQVPYAARVHWGDSRTPGRPFLQDAARRVERSVVDRYSQKINQLLDRIRS